jgi:tRNA dimethylallyltransferase
MSEAPRIAIIGGPTASGKTALSIALAQHWGCHIINADSRQVYTELNIGVAKPTSEELATVPHRLFGHVSIQEDYNAERYAQEAAEAVRLSMAESGSAILCGGTGLYIRALMEGMNRLPEPSEDVQKQVQYCFDQHGIVGLRKAIMAADPLAHERLDMFNPQRMQRALELLWESGQSLNDLYQNKAESPLADLLSQAHIEYLALQWDREDLYHRIHARCDQMMENGLLDEATALLPYQHLNALQTVGYTEWFDYRNRLCNYREALDQMKQNTRRYAKRQVTWFKNQFPTRWIPANQWAKDPILDS